ncbi:MAG: hemolysin family protein [Aquificaceae bacterium]|nr:hemolysin family protein [Aquificaceae bacterium]MDW8237914.1 hemolysin family protein [Aquificaceae bacterium]
MEGGFSAIYIDAIFILILILLSGFFSSSEIVFFGADLQVLKLRVKSTVYKAIYALISRPTELLMTIIIGNELVNVLISSYTASILLKTFGSEGTTLAVLLSSALIFLFGEVLPKNVALPSSTHLLPLYYPLFRLFHRLFYPFRLMAKVITKKLAEPKANPEYPKDSFIELVNLGLQLGYFQQSVYEPILRASLLSEKTVREIMTPLPDVFMLPEDATVESSISELLKRKHSHVVITDSSQDTIKGILRINDLVPLSENKDKKLGELARKSIFVPELMPITELLSTLRKEGSKIALVIDEHGELVGLVTFHDVLMSVFGPVPEGWEGEFVNLSVDSYMVKGWANVEEVAKAIGFELPEDYDYDTIGGFVMSNLVKVPEEGDEFTYMQFKFTVNKMHGNRIIDVLVQKLR